MKRRFEHLRDEVIAQNRLAADSRTPVDDPDVMYVLETAVGGANRRLYELGLGRVIARLAEELARVEAELDAIEPTHPQELEPVHAGAHERRPHRRHRRC